MQEGCSTSIRMRFPSSCLSLMFPRVMFYTSCHEHDQILTCMLHALQSPGPPSSPIIMATWPGTLQIPSPRSAADDPHGRHVRDPVSVSMCLSDLGLSMFFSTLQSSSNRNFVGLITSLRQYSCHFAQALGSPSKSQEKAVPARRSPGLIRSCSHFDRATSFELGRGMLQGVMLVFACYRPIAGTHA